MMEPFTITATCLGVVNHIFTLSNKIKDFVIVVREARSDMLGLASELSTLSLSLSMLQDDCTKIPFPESVMGDLSSNLKEVLKKCDDTTKEMMLFLDNYKSKQFLSGFRWAVNGRDEMNRLKQKLESSKPTIGLALMVGQVILLKSIKEDTVIIKDHTTAIKNDTAVIPSVKNDTTTIIKILSDKFNLSDQQNGKQFVMQRFYDEMTTSVESVVDELDLITWTPEVGPKEEDKDESANGATEIPPISLAPAEELELGSEPMDIAVNDAALQVRDLAIESHITQSEPEITRANDTDLEEKLEHCGKTYSHTAPEADAIDGDSSVPEPESKPESSDNCDESVQDDGCSTTGNSYVMSDGLSNGGTFLAMPPQLPMLYLEEIEPLQGFHTFWQNESAIFVPAISAEQQDRDAKEISGSDPREDEMMGVTDVSGISTDSVKDEKVGIDSEECFEQADPSNETPTEVNGSITIPDIVAHETVDMQAEPISTPESKSVEADGLLTSLDQITTADLARAQLSQDEAVKLDHELETILTEIDDFKSDRVSQVKNLLDQGAGASLESEKLSDGHKLTGLDAALLMEVRNAPSPEVIRLLLSRGAKASAHPELLLSTIVRWDLVSGTIFLGHGAQLDAVQKENPLTALLFDKAKKSLNFSEMVQLFLRLGANPNYKYEDSKIDEALKTIPATIPSSERPGSFPGLADLYTLLTGRHQSILSWTCQNCDTETIKYCLDSGAIISEESLRTAALCGNLEAVRCLLEFAQLQNLKLQKGLAAYCAAAIDRRDIVDLLKENGADILVREKFNIRPQKLGIQPIETYPLLLAVEYGQVTAVRLLLEAEFQVLQTRGNPLLEIIIAKNQRRVDEMIGFVLEKFTVTDTHRDEATCKAIQLKDPHLLSILLRRFKNVDARDSQGFGLCTQAARTGQTDLLKVILEHEPLLSGTALRTASSLGHLDIVKLLLDDGVPIDDTDEDHHTSLYFACENLHVKTVKYLVSRKANVLLKSPNGTPLKAAQKRLRDFKKVCKANPKDSKYLGSVNLCEQLVKVLEDHPANKKKGFFRKSGTVSGVNDRATECTISNSNTLNSNFSYNEFSSLPIGPPHLSC